MGERSSPMEFVETAENLVAPGVGSKSPLPFDEIQSLPWTLSPGETEEPPLYCFGYAHPLIFHILLCFCCQIILHVVTELPFSFKDIFYAMKRHKFALF